MTSVAMTVAMIVAMFIGTSIAMTVAMMSATSLSVKEVVTALVTWGCGLSHLGTGWMGDCSYSQMT